MYVCICHAITEGDIREAKSSGSLTHRDVFNHFGVKPRCGRCLQCFKGKMDGTGSKGCNATNQSSS